MNLKAVATRLFIPWSSLLRAGANIVAFAREFIFGIHFWIFYLLILAICILQNGFWYSSFAPGFALLSRDLTHNPMAHDPGAQWALTSFLGPVLAHFVRIQTAQAYAWMQLSLLLCIFTLLIAVIRRRHGEFAARAVLILFLASPISTVLLTWLGSPDVLTFLLSVGVVLLRSNAIGLFVVSAMLGTNHPEQGLAILGLIGIDTFFRHQRRVTLQYAIAAFGGLLVGAGIVQWWFRAHDFGLLFTRTNYIAAQGLGEYARQLAHAPLALFLSLFGGSVVFVIADLHRFQSKAFLLQGASAFLLVCITFDQTRVFALLTFPALLLLALTENQEKQTWSETILTLTLLAALILPRLIVHGGIPHLGFDLGQAIALHFR